jgi:K+ transporter
MVLGFVVLPLLVLGLLSFIEGMLIRIKVRREKGRLINTKPLWISALILLGISLVFIVLAASNVELLIFGGLISLPIALILTIVASRIDRGNRKAQQNQSNSQPPKERFRKLKKVLKWVAIGLTAMLLALIIGFISNL